MAKTVSCFQLPTLSRATYTSRLETPASKYDTHVAINYFEDERGQVFLVTLLCIYNGNDVAFKAFRAIFFHVKGRPVFVLLEMSVLS